MENEKAARNKKIRHAIMIIVLAILFVAFIFPFIMVIINVFKVKADITANPLALIGKHGFTLENFPNAIKKMNFWNSFGNSLFITIFSTIGTIILQRIQELPDNHHFINSSYHLCLGNGIIRNRT